MTKQPAPEAAESRPNTGKGLAVASLVLALLSILLGPLTAVPSIIAGCLAMKRVRRTGMLASKTAVVGVIISLITSIAWTAFIGIQLPKAQQSARRAACAGNLKQFAVVFKRFTRESFSETLPELSPEAGRLMFRTDSTDRYEAPYPKYLTDLSPLYCPGHKDMSSTKAGALDLNARIDDHSYFYFGYALFNEREFVRFAEAYRAHVTAGLTFERDLVVGEGLGSAGADRFYRLRGPYIPEITSIQVHPSMDPAFQSQIPVLMDRTVVKVESNGSTQINAERSNHPDGANVLYLDGHVEFLQLGSWPVTEKTLDIFQSLDDMGH